MSFKKRLIIGIAVATPLGFIASLAGQLYVGAGVEPAQLLYWTVGGFVCGLLGATASALGFEPRDFR